MNHMSRSATLGRRKAQDQRGYIRQQVEAAERIEAHQGHVIRHTLHRRLLLLAIVACLAFTHVAHSAQADVYGTFIPDGKCVPSISCCCATGPIKIAPADAGDGAVVTGDLDGGSGCRNFGSVTSVFSYFPYISYQTVNSTAIAWTLPIYGDQYIASITDTYDKIIVQKLVLNPLVDSPNCFNVLHRQQSGVPPSDGVTPTGPASDTGTTSNRGDGSFEVITTPISMGTNVQESIYDADGVHKIKFGVFRVNAASEQYNVWLEAIPKASQSISLNWADIHFITPTTNNPSTATIASPINKVMVKQTSDGRSFRYGPIPINNNNGMRFSFSYLIQGGDIVHTPTFYFVGTSATTATAFTSTNTGGTNGGGGGGNGNCDPVCETQQPSAAMQRQFRFLGVYETDTSKCTSSSSCCCSVGSITATEIASDRTKISLAGSLDGSDACAGQTTVAGDFNITGDYTASYTYPDYPITLTLTLSEDGNSVEFTNSMYSCKSYATRVSSVTMPSTETVCTTPSSCNNGGGGGGGGGGEPVCTTVPTPDDVKRQYRFQGTWKLQPDMCTPSSSCCCGGSDMTATIVTTNTSLIALSGALDGSQACAGMSEVSGDFTIVDDDTAVYTYPDYPITLTYKLSNNANTATFSNNMYTCTSTFTRLSGGPSTVPASTQVCTGGGGGTNNGNNNGDSGGGQVTTALRDQVVGTWVSTGSCVPSQNCCCVKGTMSVLTPAAASSNPAFPPPENSGTADPNSISTLYVYGGLDGGVACMRRTDMSGYCSLKNSTYGSCRLGDITFDARLTGPKELTISNSKYFNCYSVVRKVSDVPTTNITSAAPTTRPSPLLAFFIYSLIAFVTLLVYIRFGVMSG